LSAKALATADDQLLRVKAWMMPLLGKSRVDQAGAQNARATLFRPLLPCAPLLAISPYRVEDIQPATPPPNGFSFPSTPRFPLITVRRTLCCISSIHLSFNVLRSSRPSQETSSPTLHINKILLSTCSGIRTTFKLLTLFFSFPSFYERQTPFPSPLRAQIRLRALTQNPKDPKTPRQLQLTNFQWPIPNAELTLQVLPLPAFVNSPRTGQAEEGLRWTRRRGENRLKTINNARPRFYGSIWPQPGQARRPQP
jgi:hypothetical protein